MSLLKSTFWYTFGLLLTRSINFILLPVYSNLLTPDEYGIYILILTSYTILAALYQGGLSAGFTKYYLEEKEESNREIIFTSILNIIVVTGFVLSAAGIIFSTEISGILLNSRGYSRLISTAFGVLFFDSLSFYFLHLLRTREQAGKVTFLNTVSGIFNLVLNLLFLYIFKLGILGILLAQLISGIILLISAVVVSKYHIKLIIDMRAVKKILIFSAPLLLAGFFSTLVDFVDRYILDFYFDKATVGIYSFSYRIAMVINVFVLSYRTAWIPYAMNKYGSNDFYEDVKLSISKLVGILSLIFLAVSILSDDLFSIHIGNHYLFNEQYISGIKIIPYVLLGYAFSGLSSIYTLSPYLSGKSYHFLYSDILAFVINIVLNFVLIPKYGITGAAAATMVSYAAGLIYLWLISRNNLKIQYDTRNIILILFLVIVFCLISNSFKMVLGDVLIICIFLIFLKLLLKVNIGKIFPLNLQ